MIGQMLSRAAVARRGMFRPEAVERLLKDHFQGGRDNAIKIWGLLMLEVWHQMYIDRVPDPSSQFLLAASETKSVL
jgi:asparagine synthase (glutamine-hydrolysing)